MKSLNTTQIFFIVCLLVAMVLLVLPELAMSQPPPPPVKPSQAPIDGGLGLLAAAGGAYALMKLRDKQK